jgi:uncharacterized protein DUF4345
MIKLETISKVVLLLLGAGFLSFAVQGTFTPDHFFGQLDLPLPSVSGRSELRTAYAGMFGATALLFFRTAYREEERNLALWLAVMIFGLFVLARVYSMVVDGIPNRLTMIYIVVEVIGLVIPWIVLKLRR